MAAIEDFNGPDVPLGFIAVAAPGTPVQLTSVINPTGEHAPEVSNRTSGMLYPPFRFQQLKLMAFKPDGGAVAAINNIGKIYIVRDGYSRADLDGVVCILSPGQIEYLASSPRVGDTWNPYRYYVDADNAGDGVFVVGIKQG